MVCQWPFYQTLGLNGLKTPRNILHITVQNGSVSAEKGQMITKQNEYVKLRNSANYHPKNLRLNFLAQYATDSPELRSV